MKNSFGKEEGLGVALIHGYASGKIHTSNYQLSKLCKTDIISDHVRSRYRFLRQERIIILSTRGDSHQCFMCVPE